MAAVASARQELPHLSSQMDTSLDDHPPRPGSTNNVTKNMPSNHDSSTSTSASTTSGTTATSGTSKGTTSSLVSDHAPPPPPAPAQDTPGQDYFSFSSRFDQEPNPFEQSFLIGGTSSSGDPMATPKAILPPVTSITSPAPLLPGSSSSGFNWGLNSLRSGPLSPAMLQGPAVNPAIPSGTLFDSHIRTGLTPNESGIRSGLTPGGSGSMFPAPSPSSQLFQQFVTPGIATPGTMEFKKTALSAAAKNSSTAPTSSPQMGKIELPELNDPSKLRRLSGMESLHDPAQNAAANGLYLLAQAQTQQEQQQQQHQQNQYANPNQFMPPQSLAPSSLMTETSAPTQKRALVNNPPGVPGGAIQTDSRNGHGRSMSHDMMGSDDDSDSGGSENGGRSSSRGGRGGRRGGSSSGTRRKAEETKNSRSKKARQDSMSGGDEDMDEDKPGPNGEKGKKMTDEEKRRNFLERNRVAALKCRQRKKQWLASLQKKVELYTSENDALNAQVTSLREELVALKTLLIAHKDCPGLNVNIESITGALGGGMPMDYVTHSYAQLQPGVMAPPGTAARRFS